MYVDEEILALEPRLRELLADGQWHKGEALYTGLGLNWDSVHDHKRFNYMLRTHPNFADIELGYMARRRLV